ncbi:MAG: hypothetical protein BWX86_01379 [Verrucomicrobia bacterium ADurb.Bin122]|nr:MAG: hypothetical protein BWX86_01379 [Verrucomicrobia bacterium ADurb.Bin122]
MAKSEMNATLRPTFFAKNGTAKTPAREASCPEVLKAETIHSKEYDLIPPKNGTLTSWVPT